MTNKKRPRGSGLWVWRVVRLGKQLLLRDVAVGVRVHAHDEGLLSVTEIEDEIIAAQLGRQVNDAAPECGIRVRADAGIDRYNFGTRNRFVVRNVSDAADVSGPVEGQLEERFTVLLGDLRGVQRIAAVKSRLAKGVAVLYFSYTDRSVRCSNRGAEESFQHINLVTGHHIENIA